MSELDRLAADAQAAAKADAAQAERAARADIAAARTAATRVEGQTQGFLRRWVWVILAVAVAAVVGLVVLR